MNFIKKHKSVILSVLVLALFVIIGEAAIASKPKTVEFSLDSETRTIETTTKTVKELVEEQGLDINQVQVIGDLDKRVTDNLLVEVNTKKEIVFVNRGTNLPVTTFSNTVEELLLENGIDFDKDDLVSPSLIEKITTGETVSFDHILINDYAVQHDIKFETEKEFTFDLPFETKQVKVEGVDGKKVLTYTQVIKNDKVISDDLINEEITKEPTTQVLLIGTKEVVQEEVEPNLIEKSNDNMFVGESEVVQEGSNAIVKRVYKNDGTERKLVDEQIIKASVDRIVEIGTKERPSARYSLGDLMFHGILYSNGRKYTYYSQSVLPGGGLSIPGRHVNSGGFVSDSNGYIVLASAYGIPMGTIIDTPFGYQGKVYDRCASCSIEWFDVYTR